MEINDEEWYYLKTSRSILEIYHEFELQATEVSDNIFMVPRVLSLLEALTEVNTEELERRENHYLARGLKIACGELKEYYTVSDNDPKELLNLYLPAFDPRMKIDIFYKMIFSSTFLKRIDDHFMDV